MHDETAQWHLDDPLRVLGMWWQIGDLNFMQTHVFICKPAFDRTRRQEYITRFETVQNRIRAAVGFEQKHGESSFLNVDHPYIKAAIRGEAGRYSREQLAIAQRSKPERDRFMAALSA